MLIIGKHDKTFFVLFILVSGYFHDFPSIVFSLL